MKNINVLSLFDGMSCGQIALNRAGIEYHNYYASEIDKYAIEVTQKNYPDTIQLGDINNYEKWNIDFSKIDLLFAGFPCQAWSIAGKQKGVDDIRGQLVFKLLEIWNIIKKHNPEVKFLFENVKMKKEFIEYINNLFGVEPVLINSALVSAQNRNRLYWSNIGDIKQPDDKGILLKDILERDGVGCRMVGRARGTNGKRIDHKQSVAGMTTQEIEINKNPNKTNCLSLVQKDNLIFDKEPYEEKYKFNKTVSIDNDKYPTLRAQAGSKIRGIGIHGKTLYWRKLTPVECERLQTVPDNYTNHVSNTQRYKMLGNGWTVSVITHILKGIL